MSRPVLVAAVSGRALAAAARRAGYRPLVLDHFGDSDTRRLAAGKVRVVGDLRNGFALAPLLRAADALAGGADSPALVYGAGFEDRPGVLAGVAAGRRLWGNRPEVLARVKDPHFFFPLLRRLGIPHPEVRMTPPTEDAGWLVKRIGGSGGVHVGAADRRFARASDAYFQRRVEGQAISALVLADGRRALSLGFSEQWPARGRGAAFRFGGAACPARLDAGVARHLAAIAGPLVAQTGLVGLNSLDFLVRGGEFVLLEVNPRPGASLDLFDRAGPPGLFELHRRACAGALPERWRASEGAAACAIVYAGRGLRVPAGFVWPRWTADRPEPGTRVRAGAPLCTVVARAAATERARLGVLERGAAILARLADERRANPARPARSRPAAPVLP